MSKQVLQLLEEMNSDLVWYKDNLEELKKSYDNMFIAIKNGRVVAAEQDVSKLLKDLKREKVKPEQVLVQFVSSIPTIF